MNVRAVDLKEIPAIWPAVEPHVASALEYGRERFTLERVFADLVSGIKRLWVVEQGRDVLAAVVTCLTAFPGKRVCTILLCGGAEADSWVARVTGLIEEYAAWEECGQVEIIGRVGWHKKCPDYELAGVWLVKEIS